ncbi:MAG TPA: hypothetical protein VJB57_04935 [Dehalococcoidia bacterium]|nr:hypothetical protein [Dehalococcoidia bacterium]
MKTLLLLLVAGGAVMLPFVFLKQPWAIKLWRRLRLVIVIYVIVIFISAVVRLVLNWDEFYG